MLSSIFLISAISIELLIDKKKEICIHLFIFSPNTIMIIVTLLHKNIRTRSNLIQNISKQMKLI